jgi:hypothetical protein
MGDDFLEHASSRCQGNRCSFDFLTGSDMPLLARQILYGDCRQSAVFAAIFNSNRSPQPLQILRVVTHSEIQSDEAAAISAGLLYARRDFLRLHPQFGQYAGDLG